MEMAAAEDVHGVAAETIEAQPMRESAGSTVLTEGAVHRMLDALPDGSGRTAELLGSVTQGPDGFLDRVRRTILEELGLGEPKLARLAQRLQLSERTLQRWLQRERTSVQALIDGARRELALH